MKKVLFFIFLLTFAGYVNAQNVGINTTSPQATLDVKGNYRIGGNAQYMSFDSLSGKMSWYNSYLFAPVTQALMKHSAAADGLFYNNSGGINGQLEYRNEFGNPVFYTNFTNGKGYFKGRLGISTINPLAGLHVADSSVLFAGPAVLPGSPNSPPISGAGNRMMWYADKAAFRSGYVFSDNWDKDNIGDYSFASGYDSKAIGGASVAMGGETYASNSYSTAMGFQTSASGFVSTAIGFGTTASEYVSTAMGYYTTASAMYSTATGIQTSASGHASIAMGYRSTASGYTSTSLGYETIASGGYSTAIGFQSTASGLRSTAIGELTVAKSSHEVVLGRWNADYTPISTDTWNAADRLFSIGNGSGFATRSDAMTVLKNGNTGIGNSNPGFPLSFATAVGDKISLWSNSSNSYGFGIQGSLLQIHTDVSASDIAFGYGSSSSFFETMRIKGNGILQFPATLAKKITLYPGATGDVGFGVQGNQLLIYADNPAAMVRLGYDQAGVFTNNLDVYGNGNAWLRGTLTQASDSRLKKDINPLQNSLQKITKLNGYNYYWKNENADSNLQTGLLAQEVRKLFPELVKEDREGLLSVNYSGLIPLLIESIKQQQQMIEQQQSQINELRKMMKKAVRKE